jgi:hypothetical protein
MRHLVNLVIWSFGHLVIQWSWLGFCDDGAYWLEIIKRTRIVAAPEVPKLLQEAIELRAIFSRSLGTARANARAARALRRKRRAAQMTR